MARKGTIQVQHGMRVARTRIDCTQWRMDETMMNETIAKTVQAQYM